MCKIMNFFYFTPIGVSALRDARFERDSQLVVDAVLGVSNPQVTISNIIAGICQKLQAFRTMQLSYVTHLILVCQEY